MKKNYAFFLAFVLIFFHSHKGNSQTLLWTEGFEGMTSLNCGSQACGGYPSCLAGPPTNYTCIPSGWLTKVDYPWSASSNSGVAHNYSFPAQVKYVYLSGWVNYRNQWLISNGTPLTAGLTYRLAFWFKTSSETCVSACANGFNFFVGASTSQTTLPATQQVLSNGRNTTWMQFSADITAATTGTYYFGINTTYSGYTTNNWAYMDDITLTQLCTAPSTSITGTASFCAGDSTLLTANATSVNGPITGYQWQLNSVDIPGATSSTYNATAAGSYTVLVTDSGSCSATSTAFIVTVDPLPVAVFTFNYSGPTVIFTSTPQSGTTYSWDFGDGSPLDNSSNTSHTYSADGTYTVTLTVTNGCGTDVYTQQVVILGTGIDVLSNPATPLVYPNPVGDILNIVAGVEDGNYILLKIFNAYGQLVFSDNKVDAGKVYHRSVDVSEYAPGYYQLQMTSEKYLFNKRVIIY